MTWRVPDGAVVQYYYHGSIKTGKVVQWTKDGYWVEVGTFLMSPIEDFVRQPYIKRIMHL